MRQAKIHKTMVLQQEELVQDIRNAAYIVADAVKTTLRNPKESAFMLRFAAASRAASKKRRRSADRH